VVKYVGIDWAYRSAQWSALASGGEIAGEGRIAADRGGLARLVLELGDEVTACLEMMSGALWVRDELVACGWQVEVADARKVKTVAPLAAKTDKVDARLLAELCRRQLVPALCGFPRSMSGRCGSGCAGGCIWSGSARARKRASLVCRRSGASASRWRACAEATGSRCSSKQGCLRSGAAGHRAETVRQGRSAAVLLDTIPGVAELLALTIAVEIGEISRFAGPEKLVSYGRLAPRVHQSGQARPRSGPLSKSGSRLLGWASNL
jgi:transposase